jgi:hypothetical protein
MRNRRTPPESAAVVLSRTPDRSPGSQTRQLGPTRAQRVVGRIGRIVAIAFVPVSVVSAWALPGNTSGTDWGSFGVVVVIFAVLIAVPLWCVATGVRSPNRSSRRLCGCLALGGAVLPVVATIGDWGGNSWSGRLGDAIIWFPVIGVCVAMAVVTLVSEKAG